MLRKGGNQGRNEHRRIQENLHGLQIQSCGAGVCLFRCTCMISGPLIMLFAELVYDIEVLVCETTRVHEKIALAPQRGFLSLRAESNRFATLFRRIDSEIQRRAGLNPETVTNRLRDDDAAVIINSYFHGVGVPFERASTAIAIQVWGMAKRVPCVPGCQGLLVPVAAPRRSFASAPERRPCGARRIGRRTWWRRKLFGKVSLLPTTSLPDLFGERYHFR